jgi:hypothetical protein
MLQALILDVADVEFRYCRYVMLCRGGWPLMLGVANIKF